jgi:phage virion morphogenesis protein
MLTIEVDSKELENLNAGLRKITRRIDNPRSLLADYGQALVESKRSLFDRQVDPEGKAWAPLAAATIRAKRRSGAPKPEQILYNFGALAQGFTYKLIGNDSLLLEAPQVGIYHQFGTKDMPARPFMQLSGEDVVAFDRLAAKYLG